MHNRRLCLSRDSSSAICAAYMFSGMPTVRLAEILRAESGPSITMGIPYRVFRTSLRSCFPPVSAVSLWPILLTFGRTTGVNFIFALMATVIFTRFFDRIKAEISFQTIAAQKVRRLLLCPRETTDRNEIKRFGVFAMRNIRRLTSSASAFTNAVFPRRACDPALARSAGHRRCPKCDGKSQGR